MPREQARAVRSEHDGEPARPAEQHATTRGAALAGAATGGLIGLAVGPLGATLGAVGGAVVGAATERMMHGGQGGVDGEASVAHPEEQERRQVIVDERPIERHPLDRPGAAAAAGARSERLVATPRERRQDL